MYSIKFCRAPSSLWVGVVEYNGGHQFATGRTLDDLVKRMKQTMAAHYHVSARQIMLDSMQHNTYEFEKLFKVFMSPIFVGKYWRKKGEPENVEPVPDMQIPSAPAQKEMRISKRDEFITEQDGDTLVVYVLREVARYKLHGAAKAEPVVEETPAIVKVETTKPVETPVSYFSDVRTNQAPDLPVLQNEIESQEENL